MIVEIRTFADLQKEVHDALRAQNPEWVQSNGESPLCDSYEARLAELLRLCSKKAERSEESRSFVRLN
jgi:hypothetical protein